MTHLNEIVGLLLLLLGAIAVVLSLAAFVKVVFRPAPNKRGAKEILEQINALIKNWASLIKLIPSPFRHIFVLLPFGLIFILFGLYVLVNKPI